MDFGKTVSVTWGDTINRKHDFREFSEDKWPSHIDRERTKNNIVFRDATLEDTYKHIFADVIDEYNAKQTRPERCKSVEGYLNELQNKKDGRNAVKPAYELIIQVGDMFDTGYKQADAKESRQAEEILREYWGGFEKRNPNLVVSWSAIHVDESTPHLGVCVVPVGEGYRRGMSKQVSLSKALACQGFPDEKGGRSGFDRWIESERQVMESLCRKRGIDVVRLDDPKRDKMTMHEYKSFCSAFDRTIDRELRTIVGRPLRTTKKAEQGLLGYSDKDYERLWDEYIKLGMRCRADEALIKRTSAHEVDKAKDAASRLYRENSEVKKELELTRRKHDAEQAKSDMLLKSLKTVIEGLDEVSARRVLPALQKGLVGGDMVQKRLQRIALKQGQKRSYREHETERRTTSDTQSRQ